MKRFEEFSETSGRLFAVGDIHGCVHELEVLLNYIQEVLRFEKEDRLVFAGDYIDRGPGSRQVVDLLLDFQEHFPDSSVFLKGNHEDMFLDFLGFGGTLGESFAMNGGSETLASYGVGADAKSIDEVLARIPGTHLQFYKNLSRYCITPDYVFAHAGVSPLRDLQFQIDDDLFWIRDEFIQNIHHFERTVVFGHTPFENVMFDLPYKIGIDTGLVYGNMLSCIELTERRLFQIGAGEYEVRESTFPS